MTSTISPMRSAARSLRCRPERPGSRSDSTRTFWTGFGTKSRLPEGATTRASSIERFGSTFVDRVLSSKRPFEESFERSSNTPVDKEIQRSPGPLLPSGQEGSICALIPSTWNSRVSRSKSTWPDRKRGRVPEISRFFGVLIRMYFRDHPPRALSRLALRRCGRTIRGGTSISEFHSVLASRVRWPRAVGRPGWRMHLPILASIPRSTARPDS